MWRYTFVDEVDERHGHEPDLAERGSRLGRLQAGQEEVLLYPLSSRDRAVEGLRRGPGFCFFGTPPGLGCLITAFGGGAEVVMVVAGEMERAGAVAHTAGLWESSAPGGRLGGATPVDTDEEGQDARIDEAGPVRGTVHKVVRVFSGGRSVGLAHAQGYGAPRERVLLETVWRVRRYSVPRCERWVHAYVGPLDVGGSSACRFPTWAWQQVTPARGDTGGQVAAQPVPEDRRGVVGGASKVPGEVGKNGFP